jgi:hypothetical protein
MCSQGVGWLAREDHLAFRQVRGVLKVAVQDARQA